MPKQNGMMTYFVLFIGSIVMLLTLVISIFSSMYFKQSLQYHDGITSTYLAESALCLYWDKLQSLSWDEIPRREDKRLDDEFDVITTDEEMRVLHITEKSVQPNHGIIYGIGKNKNSETVRTISLKYNVEVDNNKKWIYKIENVSY